MTTTTRERTRERAAEEQGGEEQEGPFGGINPLLLAALMGRREEREGMHPLLLAALMARREEGEGMGMHPLLLAALMSRREARGERGEGMAVLLFPSPLPRAVGRGGGRWLGRPIASVV